jgi:DNA-binding NtrC family response regulator
LNTVYPLEVEAMLMSKYSVLIVDDEDNFRDSLRDRLQFRGYAVGTAPTGEEGLKILDQRDFDVVVLDLRMPGMDGLECLKQIKAMKPLVEVVLLTGHGTVNSGVEGLELGAFDYLLKPVPLGELLEKIDLAYEHKLRQEKH